MEYLIVKYHETRPVIIDDEIQGNTNRIIELPGGQHNVTLDGPADFSPPEHTVNLHDTSVTSPYEILFT